MGSEMCIRDRWQPTSNNATNFETFNEHPRLCSYYHASAGQFGYSRNKELPSQPSNQRPTPPQRPRPAHDSVESTHPTSKLTSYSPKPKSRRSKLASPHPIQIENKHTHRERKRGAVVRTIHRGSLCFHWTSAAEVAVADDHTAMHYIGEGTPEAEEEDILAEDTLVVTVGRRRVPLWRIPLRRISVWRVPMRRWRRVRF